MKSHQTIFHWSGGKDSSIALHRMLQDDEQDIGMLLTAVNTAQNRISMHGVRLELIKCQAKQIGIPLATLDLPEQPGMQEYNQLMNQKMKILKEEGYTHSAFGDIFLEDLKTFRENQMQKAGVVLLFPIWKGDTRQLIRQFIDDGFKAVVVCAKAEKLGQNFAGRLIDDSFLNDLPEGVDPCGENGEFHTFVYDGPIFSQPIPFKKGAIIYREYNAPKKDEDQCGLSDERDPKKMGFWFCDLIPV